ncbi:MAG: methionine--tRNA ligase [Thermoprotei archaeon]|nr:MAG: methionine--tRNA ligase [Thermoprotei archaeon]
MEKWLICSAWPYVNAVPHLGNIIGSVLSADVAARYFRMKGAKVLFVSGSDEHGTPIEVEAVKRGMEPRQLTDMNHAKVSELFRRWRISFDNYTRTESPVHKEFVRRFYMRLYERGYIFEQEVEMPYCPRCERFLPDRFIRGTCPYCGFPDAKGDQCDQCGRLLTPLSLVDPRCAICGAKPVIRSSKHWFFDLPKLTNELVRYIEGNENLPDNARNMSLQMLREGLKPRSVTRDNKWGIPAPFPGAEGKTIYVWMEAVLGYVSAVIEYFKRRGEEDGWKEFWLDEGTKSVYFIGKDNIPFHTIIFPALLMASGEGYVLPWTVASTEYLLFEGQKFSKSRGIGIWIDEALELLPVDYWRFALLATRPETKDTNFSWKMMQEVINTQLNDAIGNFIHRTLTFIYRNFSASIPEPGELDDYDRELEKVIGDTASEAARLLESFRLKMALSKVVDLSRLGNKYLNDREPWRAVKTDPVRAGTTLYVAAHVVKALGVMLYPFIPDSSLRILKMLGYDVGEEELRWDWALEPVPPGQRIPKPEPLFKKLSDEDVAELQRRLLELRAKRKGEGP